jgi:hypothetical protein
MNRLALAIVFILSPGSLVAMARPFASVRVEGADTAASPSGRSQDPGPAGSRAGGQEDAATARDVCRVFFRVVDRSTKRPLQGVTLEVWIDGRVVRHQVTDEAGRMIIPLPRERFARLAVTARKDGLAPMRVELRRATVPDLEIPRSYTLAMAPGTSIGGIVCDVDGRPIEGASVTFQQTSRRDRVREVIDLGDVAARTDPRGRWQIDRIPEGFDLGGLRFTFSHPEFQGPIEASTTAAGRTPEELRRQSGVIVLRRAIAVTGRVLDRWGRPIAGASVRLGERSWHPAVKTGADGRFRFPPTGPSQSFLTVEAVGFAPEARPVRVGEGFEPVEFRLGPGRTIRGRVVDTQRQPLAGLMLFVARWNGPPTLSWRAETDAEGRFVWDGAPTDRVALRAEKEAYRAVELTVEPSKNEPVITLAVANPLRFRGTVTDAETGQAIEEFTVAPGFSATPTDWMLSLAKTFYGGRYEYPPDRALSGFQRVRVEAKGYLPATSPAYSNVAGPQTFDVRMRKGDWLEGVVRGPDGQPLAAAEVIAVSGWSLGIEYGKDYGRQDRPHVVTGADGRFSLSPLERPYRIVALHESGYVEVTDRQWAERRGLTVAPWGRIEGTWRAGGRPLANETVVASLDEYQGDPTALQVHKESRAETDENGHFVIEKVAPGEARVHWQPRPEVARGRRTPSRYYQPAFVVVLPGQTARVDVFEEGGRPLVGRVVLPSAAGGPIEVKSANAYLVLKEPQAPYPPGLTERDRRAWHDRWRLTKAALIDRHRRRGFSCGLDIREDGSFRVDEVQPGTYELHVRVPDHVELIREVVVPDLAENRDGRAVDLGVLTLEKAECPEAHR